MKKNEVVLLSVLLLILRLFNGGDRGHTRCAGEHGEHETAASKGKAEDDIDGGGT